MSWLADQYAAHINYGRSWRNFQVIWWGWRWAWRSPLRFERATPPWSNTYRWCLFIGPVEIRRWAEDWRDQQARLAASRASRGGR